MLAYHSRRCFIKTTAAGILSSGVLLEMAQRLAANQCCDIARPKIKIAKIYMGHERPGWPSHQVDLKADMLAFERELAKLSSQLADVEFIEAGLVSSAEQLNAAKEKIRGAAGILAIHLTMGIGGYLQSLFATNLPIVLFSLPYSGHEWHTIASWQKQGKLIEVFPTSRHTDVLTAIRPFRAIQRLSEAKVLHISQHSPDASYCKALKEKFGTEIIGLGFRELQQAYDDADRSEAMADMRQWVKEAKKIIEPTRDDILKSSVMYIAMRDLLRQHQAEAVTMNCLGMGLMEHGMGYPCLGFVRFNNMGLGGVCEADIKSTMTHLIFRHLVGRPGFVTDPVLDFSNGTIIHAHCVAATRMEGPSSPAAPYHIRTHLEDGKGVSLMVKLPTDKPLTMARLLGTDKMLFSTGTAVGSPFVDRGCRTKLTMKVDNIEKFLENWSSGLHRVVFYGDHTRDIRSYCRFNQIQLLNEGKDDLQNVPGLEWEPHVHA